MSKNRPSFTNRVRAALAAGEPLPLIRGGDGTGEPTLPRTEDGALDVDALRAMSDGELGALDAELATHYTAVRESETPDVALLTIIRDARLALREIAAERYEAAANPTEDPAAALAALDESLADPEPEPQADPAPAPVADPAPATASVTPLVALSMDDFEAMVARVVERQEPVVAAADPDPEPGLVPLPASVTVGAERTRPDAIRPGMVITAAGDVPGLSAGHEFGGLLELSEAIIDKRKAIGKPGRMTGQTLDRVARLTAEWPDDRKLSKLDGPEQTAEKINAVAGEEALVASGGLCAPVQPYYEIMTLARASRPVRDSLPSFNADRGGIRLIPPPQFSDAAGSVGFITAAVDAAALGGSGGQISAATKPCLHATCPGVQEYDVAAVTRCLEFGNFTTRAYPEQVTAWVTLSMAQHARKAETALIDGIATASTQVTAAAVVGAARDLLATIAKAAAYYRNRNRMDADAPLRTMLPAWSIDLMIADLTHGSGYETEYFAMARSEIEAALAELNINCTFYLDSGTAKGQLINSGNVQTAGALVAFPTTVVWYLFAEGSFLFLDAGTLDLGVVRDSALNNLNNYRLFAETFETVAFVGVESLEVTQTCSANGTFSGPAFGSTTVSAPVAIPSTF